MNNITFQTKDRIDQSVFQMTNDLERLWLLSALHMGLDQMARGETVLADESFFDAMHDRLFSQAGETVIEA